MEQTFNRFSVTKYIFTGLIIISLLNLVQSGSSQAYPSNEASQPLLTTSDTFKPEPQLYQQSPTQRIFDIRFTRNIHNNIVAKSTDTSQDYNLKLKTFNVESDYDQSYSDSVHNRFRIVLPSNIVKAVVKFEKTCLFPIMLGQSDSKISISAGRNEVIFTSTYIGVSLIDQLESGNTLNFMNYKNTPRSYDDNLYTQTVEFREELAHERYLEVFCIEFSTGQSMFEIQLSLTTLEQDTKSYVDITHYYNLNNEYKYSKKFSVEPNSILSLSFVNLTGQTTISSSMLSNKNFQVQVYYIDSKGINQTFTYNESNAPGFTNIEANSMIVSLENMLQDRTVTVRLTVSSKISSISAATQKTIIAIVVIISIVIFFVIIFLVIQRSCRKKRRRTMLPSNSDGQSNTRRGGNQDDTMISHTGRVQNNDIQEQRPVIYDRIPHYRLNTSQEAQLDDKSVNINISTLNTNKAFVDLPDDHKNQIRTYAIDHQRFAYPEYQNSNVEMEYEVCKESLDNSKKFL